MVPRPLLSFMLFHRSMREGARRVVKAVEGDAPGVAAWFAHYREACTIHATGEDEVLWPALAEARPDLSGTFAAMETEHDELERVLHALDVALADHSGDRHDLAVLLVDLVDRHLDDEEATVVPALVDAFQPEALGELMKQVQQAAGPDGAAVALPFLLEHASDEERATVLANVPAPVREGYEATWRADYDSLVDGAAA